MNLKRHLVALTSMALGGGAVLGVVFGMNAYSQAPKNTEEKRHANFKVEEKKPPPKKKPQEPQRKKQTKTTAAPRAPAPHLVSAIGDGISFDLPGFASADFGNLGDRLLGDTTKQTAMTADTVDEPPRARSRVQPAYPDKARQKGITGYVTMKIKVGANGTVNLVRVVEASPRGVFEDSATASVRQWQFDPGLYQGNPVETWVNQTLRFELN